MKKDGVYSNHVTRRLRLTRAVLGAKRDPGGQRDVLVRRCLPASDRHTLSAGWLGQAPRCWKTTDFHGRVELCQKSVIFFSKPSKTKKVSFTCLTSDKMVLILFFFLSFFLPPSGNLYLHRAVWPGAWFCFPGFAVFYAGAAGAQPHL